MHTAATALAAPNLVFSHFGMTVSDMPTMERFYTDVLGYTITDRGNEAGIDFVFLSRDVREHHQIALTSGRPDNIPPNRDNPHFGACIQHISFRMASLADLRDIFARLQAGGATGVRATTHGIMWSVYAHDPEGNLLEFYTMTEWYVHQPFIAPIDFSETNEDIVAATKALCIARAEFEPLADWQDRLAQRITPFVE